MYFSTWFVSVAMLIYVTFKVLKNSLVLSLEAWNLGQRDGPVYATVIYLTFVLSVIRDAISIRTGRGVLSG